ncbi:glycosyltransferase, partial [Helicobacter pylori]
DKIYPYEGFFYCNLTYQRKNQFCKKILEIIRVQKIDKEPQLTEFCRSKIAPLKIEYCIFPHYYRLSEEHLKGVANAIYHNTIKQALREPIVIQYDSHPYFQIKPWDYPFGLKADLWLNALAKTPFMSDWSYLITGGGEIGGEKWHHYHSIVAYHYYFPLWKAEEQIAHDALKTFLKHYFLHIHEIPQNARRRLFKYCISIPLKSFISKTLKFLKLHALVKKILIQLKLLKKS